MNYNNSKIYKIVNNVSDKIYIGSTTQSLSSRMSVHRYEYNIRRRNNCRSQKIFEEDYDSTQIILLEDCNFETKEQLKARERYYIDNNNCVNKQIPLRTRQEYNLSIRDKIIEYRLEHYVEFKAKNKIYRDNSPIIDCLCGGQFKKCNLSDHKKTKKHINYIENN